MQNHFPPTQLCEISTEVLGINVSTKCPQSFTAADQTLPDMFTSIATGRCILCPTNIRLATEFKVSKQCRIMTVTSTVYMYLRMKVNTEIANIYIIR